MKYVDCYLAPVPRANKAAYQRTAESSAGILKEYGALRTMECWLDESGPEAASYHGDTARRGSNEYAGFFTAAGAKAGETVVMSWVEWPDKATRDAGMEKFTSDPRVQFEGEAPAFDGSRLIAGGFIPML